MGPLFLETEAQDPIILTIKLKLNDVLFTYNLSQLLQPFAKRLAVTNLGNYENKQYTIDPKLGFTPLYSVYSLIQPSTSGKCTLSPGCPRTA
jgi:hypothetical protein